MALSLSCHLVERNDNKLLTVTDTTGGCSSTSWGVGSNPDVDTITAIGDGTPLTLTIKITKSDASSITYDPIDLMTTFFPDGASTYEDLVFAITTDMLVVSGEESLSLDGNSIFPDGIYEVKYAYGEPGEELAYSTDVFLLDGVVTASIYKLLGALPAHYECGAPHEKLVLDTIFLETYLSSMHVATYVARTDSILTQLKTLQRLVSNVSTFTW